MPKSLPPGKHKIVEIPADATVPEDPKSGSTAPAGAIEDVIIPNGDHELVVRISKRSQESPGSRRRGRLHSPEPTNFEEIFAPGQAASAQPENSASARGRKLVFSKLFMAAACAVLVATPTLILFALWPHQPTTAPPRPPDPARSAINEAKILVEQFLGSPTPDSALRFVRFPEADRPSVERFYKETAGERQFAPLTRLKSHENTATCVACFYTERNKQTPHIIAVVRTQEGNLAIDWACFSASNPVSLSTLDEQAAASESGVASAFRVVAEATDYYNYDFADSGQWDSFSIEIPSESESVFAYAKRDTRGSNMLRELLLDQPRQRLTIRLLATPESGRTRQYQILGLLAPGWVLSEPDPAPGEQVATAIR